MKVVKVVRVVKVVIVMVVVVVIVEGIIVQSVGCEAKVLLFSINRIHPFVFPLRGRAVKFYSICCVVNIVSTYEIRYSLLFCRHKWSLM